MDLLLSYQILCNVSGSWGKKNPSFKNELLTNLRQVSNTSTFILYHIFLSRRVLSFSYSNFLKLPSKVIDHYMYLEIFFLTLTSCCIFKLESNIILIDIFISILKKNKVGLLCFLRVITN